MVGSAVWFDKPPALACISVDEASPVPNDDTEHSLLVFVCLWFYLRGLIRHVTSTIASIKMISYHSIALLLSILYNPLNEIIHALITLIDWILLRLRSSPTPDSQDLSALQEEVGPCSILQRLPSEILLRTIYFLPLSSIACLSLTSKWYHATLHGHFDPKMPRNSTEKARFLRLLEEDLPTMILCSSCNILYRWQDHPRGCCARYLDHVPMRWGT